MNKIIKVPAKADQLEIVQNYVEEMLEANECPLKIQFNINIAVEEIFVNIANYAYDEPNGEVEIIIDLYEKERKISISFIDSGIAFNPLAKEDADITLSAEEREIGGLGILMVKKTMDKVEYVRENNMNKLTIEKDFE